MQETMNTEIVDRHVFGLRRHHRLAASAFRSGIDPTDLEFASRLKVNECGDCSMCCELPAISEEQYADSNLDIKPTHKSFGKKCELLSCSGCSRYDDRPSVCRGYMCLYTLGIIQRSPKVSGVAWSIEPEMEHMNSWAAIGHCYDADSMCKNADVLAEALLLQHSVMSGLPVAYVVLRSPSVGIRLRFKHSVKGDELDFSYSAERANLVDTHVVETIQSTESIELDESVISSAIKIVFNTP